MENIVNDSDKLCEFLKEMIIDTLKLEETSAEEIGDDAPLFKEGLGLDSIDALDAGTLVIISTSGNAFARLGPHARRALSACGSAVDPSQHPGAAHVMIGYKGAEPGSVPEQVGDRLVRVVVGQDPERMTMELVGFDLATRAVHN